MFITIASKIFTNCSLKKPPFAIIDLGLKRNLTLGALLKFKAHISTLILLLFLAIIPHESWHLLMNHNDTHCEFHHENTIEQKHQHCEMLAFEISSFEYSDLEIQSFNFYDYIKRAYQCIYNYHSTFKLAKQLRGPPFSIDFLINFQ